MNLKDTVPILIYDDKCYVCTKFAKFVNFLTRGKITLIGHYTNLGEKLRNEILDSTALTMFWFVDGKMAYGGRAALFPLSLAILRRNGNKTKEISEKNNCPLECKNPKAVFLRSASLILNYKKIKIMNDDISLI
jgi:hypothetical protein